MLLPFVVSNVVFRHGKKSFFFSRPYNENFEFIKNSIRFERKFLQLFYTLLGPHIRNGIKIVEGKSSNPTLFPHMRLRFFFPQHIFSTIIYKCSTLK